MRKAEDSSAWAIILKEAMDKLQTEEAKYEEFVQNEFVMSHIRIS